MLADSPVVTVHVPPQLRSLAGGHAEILASGDTVAEVLEAAAHGYPAMRGHLVAADGELAPGLEVYLGGRSVSEMQGLKTPIELEELVSIVPTGNGKSRTLRDRMAISSALSDVHRFLLSKW